MTDRGWFGRARSAHTAQQATQHSAITSDIQSEAGDQALPASLHRSLTQVSLHQNQQHKPLKLVRISSLIGLGTIAKAQSHTPPIYPEIVMERSESMKSGPTGYQLAAIDGGSPMGEWRHASKKQDLTSYNEADQTWHNPSLKQMTETVSCTMMKNGTSAPIPRHLNGWIAGIIEEVSHQISEVNDLRAQVAQFKAIRNQEMYEFSQISDEWARHEENFKAEINRLEHIISDTQQGAESVLLARAGSVINHDHGRAFRARLERLSRSDECNEGLPVDRHRDYLIEQDKRDSISLSPGDVGLTTYTTPYKVLGCTPSLLERDGGVHLSKQLRDVTPKRYCQNDQDISKKLVAARILLETTGKPPAPSTHHSNNSSSPSSGGIASCSSSLIAQGLAEEIAKAHITPHTSPIKDESLGGLPVKEQHTDVDILGTIRKLAAQNAGLPDDAIDDESNYSSSVVSPGRHRAFSFSGSEKFAPDDETNFSIARVSGHVSSSSRRFQQLSAVEELRSGSQLDGAARLSEEIAPVGPRISKSDSSSTSSDTSQHRSHASMLRSMGYNHANKKQGKKLDTIPVCSPMIIALAREISSPCPSSKVQKGQVPVTPWYCSKEGIQRRRLINRNYPKGRAFVSDGELALASTQIRTGDETPERAQGHMGDSNAPSAFGRLPSDAGCNQEAPLAAARALTRSTPGRKSQHKSQAEAA